MSVVSIPSIGTTTKRHLYSWPSSSSSSSLPALSPLPLKPCNPNHNQGFLHCSNSSFLLHTPIPKPYKALTHLRRSILMMSMEAGVSVMGTKLGMMSYFEPSSTVVPVTVIGFREGNIVAQVKTEAADDYDAIQVGYHWVWDRKLTKPELGHLQKSSIIPLHRLQEFRLVSIESFQPNQRLVID